jgi:ADP-heptose:LPS heptosyltransferase
MVEARGDILLARAIYHDLSTKFPNTKIGRDAKNALASMAAHRPDMN